MRLHIIFACLIGLTAGIAQADSVELVNCQDGQGRTIRGVADASLPVLLRVGRDDGQRVIRYSPDLLPDLSAEARQFFYARECARVAMGDASHGQASVVRARQADCLGLVALRDSGLLKSPADIQRLEAELEFSDEEWLLLPGPPRPFALAACPKPTGLRLPLPAAPNAGQVAWNTCTRQCGDRLLHCQRSCRAADCGSCQAAYDRCQENCKARAEP